MISDAYASTVAVVKSPWAFLYADLDLKAPIGKLSQGTRLKIGEKLRRHGSIALTTHQDKIVYLKVKDLTISGVKDQFEVQTNRYKVIETEEMNKARKDSKAYLTFHFDQSVPGSEWNNLAKQMESDKTQLFYTLGLSAKYNFFQTRYSISSNIEYTSSYDPQVQIQAFGIDILGHIALINSNFLAWEVFAGPSLAPNVLIQTENKQYFTKGSGYGYKVGTEVHFLNFWSYHLSAGLLYRNIKLEGHDQIQLPGTYRQLTSINSLSETRLFVSINKDFHL